MLRAFALLLTCVYTLLAQDSVPSDFLYHRVWAVVPMVGKGTEQDPRRPMFVSTPAELNAKAAESAAKVQSKEKRPVIDPPAILQYSMQLSDDGRFALVEFVGLNSEALAFITSSKVPGVKVFERGKTSKSEIESEFQKYKPNFRMDNFRGGSAR